MKNIIIIILSIIFIALLLFNFYKSYNPADQIQVIFATEYDNGGVMINGEGYPCGYQDNICPNDFSPGKKVCDKADPDC